MENEKYIETTDLGFRDITQALKEGTLDEIKKCDVIRNITIKKEREEIHGGKKAMMYYFLMGGCKIKGRIFSLDEIVNVGEEVDLIIQNWRHYDRSLSLDTQIYHDLYKGEELRVNISSYFPDGDPSFKLFNQIVGFVKSSGNGLYRKVNKGGRLLVEVFEKNTGKHGELVKVWPLRLLKNEQEH
jgi:hypothetical protein